MDGLAGRREVERVAAAVVAGGALDEAAVGQRADEPRDLALVTARALHEIARGGAGVVCDEAERARLHDRQAGVVIGDRGLQHGLEAVHDLVEELEQELVIELVDRVNVVRHGWLMLSTNRVRHELKFRKLAVVEARDLTPGVRSLTFEGEDLHDFPSASFDDHVKLMLPATPGAPIEAPEMTPSGPRFAGPAPILRDFTPRAFDRGARRLTLEFALHAGGAAAQWARGARPGDRVAIGGPRGSMVIPLGYAWHVLVGDESALPAIARRLEELPAGSRVDVFVETVDEADRRALASAADVRVVWLRAAEDALAAEIRSFQQPAGEGFVWAAGEAASMRRVRAALRDVHGMTSSHSRVSAYWKRGVAAHHEDID